MNCPFICVAGKNNIAVDVLKYLFEHYGEENLCIICNKTETGENSFQRSLRKYAQENNIVELQLNDIYNLNNLVFISLEFDQIIKPHLFNDARLYNVHFSLLPMYKGMYTSAHPILNGENVSGVTLHCIDAGIDTGDIIDQEAFSIDDYDCKELYLQYIKYGTEVVLRNIEDIIWNRVNARKQDGKKSTYYSQNSIDYKNLTIDLNQTARGIQNQIRAYSFRDYQLPKVHSKFIIDSKILGSRSFLKPGSIIQENDSGLILSTVDYDLALYYDRFEELMLGCELGKLDLVKQICTVTKHINQQDINGWSPIIKATYFNNIDIVHYLVLMGADVHTRNNNGTNLLMYAKNTYQRYGDNNLFKLFKMLGLSEKEEDYSGKNLEAYIADESISMSELLK